MPISNKQKQIMAFGYTKYDCLIADGAIRSGKTIFMIISFVDWAMRSFDRKRFAICGETVGSVIQNIIVPYMDLTYTKRKYKIEFKRSDKLLVISRGNTRNIFEIFGGKDESSYKLIQGRTLAGILVDELVLLVESFVKQAMARCSVDGSKFWFNCNPGSPGHWFYKEFICDLKKQNALRIHFRLEDNPSLSPAILARYQTKYQGVFHKRYILGEWVNAEGLVYNFGEKNITDDVPKGAEYYVSIDYGTLNPFAAILWSVTGFKAVAVKEFYYSGREQKVLKTNSDYIKDIKEFVKGYSIDAFVVDPSAASFIADLRQQDYIVYPAKNDVKDGIRVVGTMLNDGVITINRQCVDAIREFGLYCWDEKASDDAVIKENDHAMDSIRYFCNTIMIGKDIESNIEMV